MGKVVKLEPAAKVKPDKTALVLGGGGFTGGVYEIGALRALDLLADGMSVNDFDVYVGTSAGSFIAALCANGVTPEEMMRAVTQESDQAFREISIQDLLRLNLPELAHRGLLLPVHLLSLGRRILQQRGQTSLMDLVIGLAEVLPPGLYSGAGVERYLRQVLADRDVPDDFKSCPHELYITATDLDTCERVVFGQPGFEDVPISMAVRASTALPMVYAPVRVGDRELVDGGIVSTTNLDIAVEAGAKLVIVINPIVPYQNNFEEQVRTVRGVRARRISDMGFPRVGYQAFKLLAHRRLHGMAEQWQERFPGVDIVLIEPQADDRLMFETSIMNFTSRVEIAKHGFQSVASHLSGEYETYREIFERHGIAISPERVRRVIGRFQEEAGTATSGSSWRSIFGAAAGMFNG
ncbi:MAG: patatin-like phospholipase family protein [Solirubrobacteraceae bacterium]